MASAADHFQRALDFCDRALDQLGVLDQPRGEKPWVHEVIPFVEAARTELVAVLIHETVPNLSDVHALDYDLRAS
jgi:hypothetical protein